MAALLPFKVPEISAADFCAFHEAHFSNLPTGHFESHFLRPNELVVASVSASAATANGLAASRNGNTEAEVEEYFYEEYGEEGYYEEDDDDGLGYYPDGVKRTLTDEQIAIFRHSELEAMRRVRESAKIKKVMDSAADGVAVVIEGAIGEQLSEGELNYPKDAKAGAGPSQQQQQQKKKNNSNGINKKNKNKRRGGKKNNHNNSNNNNNNNRSDGGGEQIDLRKRTWDVVDKGLASLDYGEEEHGQPSGERAVQRRRISYDD